MHTSVQPRRRWRPPSKEKQFMASWAPKRLESDTRKCVERHPTERDDEGGRRRVKQAHGCNREPKHDWHITEERE